MLTGLVVGADPFSAAFDGLYIIISCILCHIPQNALIRIALEFPQSYPQKPNSISITINSFLKSLKI